DGQGDGEGEGEPGVVSLDALRRRLGRGLRRGILDVSACARAFGRGALLARRFGFVRLAIRGLGRRAWRRGLFGFGHSVELVRAGKRWRRSALIPHSAVGPKRLDPIPSAGGSLHASETSRWSGSFGQAE